MELGEISEKRKATSCLAAKASFYSSISRAAYPVLCGNYNGIDSSNRVFRQIVWLSMYLYIHLYIYIYTIYTCFENQHTSISTQWKASKYIIWSHVTPGFRKYSILSVFVFLSLIKEKQWQKMQNNENNENINEKQWKIQQKNDERHWKIIKIAKKWKTRENNSKQ